MKRSVFVIGVSTTVVLLAAVVVGLTISRLQSKAGVLTNTLEAGGITTEIEEEGEGTVKKCRIRNTGESDCIVRARVTISPAAAAELVELTDKGADWNFDDWNGDGYVYYQKVLPAGEESYTSYLFQGVAFKEGADWKNLGEEGFSITVYQEAVQTKVYDAKADEMISALDENGIYDGKKATEVWAVYETAE